MTYTPTQDLNHNHHQNPAHRYACHDKPPSTPMRYRVQDGWTREGQRVMRPHATQWLDMVAGTVTERLTRLVVGVSGGGVMEIINVVVLNALRSGPKSRHELAEIAGLHPRQVMPHLVRLREAGRIVVNGDGDYELGKKSVD